MAGFVGICGNTSLETEQSVHSALNATVYSPKVLVRELYHDDHLILSKSYFDFLESKMYAFKDGVHVWVDGEIYNQPDIRSAPVEAFAETLLTHYLADSWSRLLSRVDGFFVALVYNEPKKLLFIVTDRYGLKPFYIYHRNKSLLFAPELKCFPELKSFQLQIRKDVIECFMQLEHFMGDATWFEGVTLAAPATLYRYSLSENSLTTQRYWSWAAIRKSSLSLQQAAEEMAFRVDAAMKSRYYGDYRIGVALSGGLDSRAILAAVQANKPVTYTFGIESSPDVKIARRVASHAGVEHVHYDTHVDHWLEKRFSGVWKTDGMLNMYHMHYSHLMNELPKIMDVNLSGFLGDALIGGSYLNKLGQGYLNKRINDSIARAYYGEHYSFCDTADSFFNIDKADPYLFYNRGRRMMGMGAEEPFKTVPQRLPFMATHLMDLSFSLPDELRAHSIVYDRTLLLKYPDFYTTIPHASTGVPISNHPTLLNRLKKQYYHLLHGVRYKLNLPTSFTNVNQWIKQPDSATLIRKILDPRHAIYPDFIPRNYVDDYVTPHARGNRKLMKQVMGALTMEIWFQQLLNKKYR